MSPEQRAEIRVHLSRLKRRYGIDAVHLPAAWDVLCEIAAASPALGEDWLVRQTLGIQDVRDWLARLEEGDDA